MAKVKARPAKVGTQPWLVVIDGRSTVEVGKVVRFRRAGSGEKWMRGEVTRINAHDGMPFITPVSS